MRQFPPGPDRPDVTRGARILVVDDDLFLRSVTVRTLVDLGAVVSVADGGHEAVERVAREPFDCILMDVQMPDLDGLEATRLIRAGGFAPGVPVLALTGTGDDDTRARCRAAGMSDLIVKPVKREALSAAIASWLDITAFDRRG